jgi:hypothetical protein
VCHYHFMFPTLSELHPWSPSCPGECHAWVIISVPSLYYPATLPVRAHAYLASFYILPSLPTITLRPHTPLLLLACQPPWESIMCINHTCINKILPVWLSSWIACPWRWRHHDTSKYQELPAQWHNITFQKTQIFIVTDIPYSINNLFSKHITTLNISWYYFTPVKGKYSHAPCNDISVNDGPHIRRWSHNIIIPFCYNCLQHSVQ